MDIFNVRSVLDSLNEGILYFEGATPLLCFDESTEILCLDKHLEEVYLPISELKVGSIAKSFKHGFRRICAIYKNTLINDINDYQKCMFIMPKDENMTKDLIMTGGHSILVDSINENETTKNNKFFNGYSLNIDNKQLLLAAASDKFTALDNKNKYTFYNFCLENDADDEARYGVWANGVLVDTPSFKYLKEILLKNI
jgi:hypothetical protein